MITERCQAREKCEKAYCFGKQPAYIYGLYDARLQDIFYVGSTINPSKRFADHLSGAKEPYNYKSMWIHQILESGSYPIPLLLCEFQTTCELYTKQVEREIADQLRAEGHAALCDWHGSPERVKNYMEEKYPYGKVHWTVSRRVELNLWTEYIDRTAESARIQLLLKEMFHCG